MNTKDAVFIRIAEDILHIPCFKYLPSVMLLSLITIKNPFPSFSVYIFAALFLLSALSSKQGLNMNN